jgi:hypothetical protein
MNRKNANTVNEVSPSQFTMMPERQRSLLKMTSGLIPFYQGQDDASISNGSVVCQSPRSVRHTLSHAEQLWLIYK